MLITNYKICCEMLYRVRKVCYVNPAINVRSLTTANAVLKA
jgi:hypothetical protein